MCHNSLDKSVATQPTVAYAPCHLFQTQPFPFFGACDPSKGQSGHTGGMNVCMGDGSVRIVSSTISPATWASACDPQDGKALGSDW